MSPKLNFRLPLLAFVMYLFVPIGTSQQVIVNSNGDRIIMYPDGSWRWAAPGDSVLVKENLRKSENIGYPSDNIDPTEKRTIGEDEEYTLRQWNELYFRIKQEEKKVQDNFRTATNAQFKANELLQSAEANKSMIDPDRLETLHEDYERSIHNLHMAKLSQKEITKIGDESKKLANKEPKKIKKKLPQLSSKFENYLAIYGSLYSAHDLASSNTPHNKSSPQNSNASNKQASTVNSNTAGPYSNIMIATLPPQEISKPYKSEPVPCNVTTDTVDTSSGRRRIILSPGLMFTHTDPDLRPYFKDKELITCYGHLSKIDAYVYFTMEFQIGSSHSQGNFGSIEKDGLLRIRLLNGKYISLYSLKADRGRIDPYTGNTIFTGLYSLGKQEMKMLGSSPLDKIRILWSTGYEDYDVYKIDFFIDQLTCLMSK